MKCSLLNVFPFLDYMRCGNESGQCIRKVDLCDQIFDCENEWDELETTCVRESFRQTFVTRRMYSQLNYVRGSAHKKSALPRNTDTIDPVRSTHVK